MSGSVLIRDPFTGKSLEDENVIINYINTHSQDLEAYKNPDDYDIDVIVRNRESNEIVCLIEVEGCWERSWNNTERPTWPSGLMTMPIRKLKYFIQENELLTNHLLNNRTIEREEFFRLYNLNNNSDFQFNPIEGIPRFWTKISHFGNYFCICNKYDITMKVNVSLPNYPRFSRNTPINAEITRNIWHNQFIRRSDKTMLIVGVLRNDLQLFYGQLLENELLEYLEENL